MNSVSCARPFWSQAEHCLGNDIALDLVGPGINRRRTVVKIKRHGRKAVVGCHRWGVMTKQAGLWLERRGIPGQRLDAEVVDGLRGFAAPDLHLRGNRA